MEEILSSLQLLDFDWEIFWRAALVLAGVALLLGVIGKLFFKKETNINQALSSVIGILFIYAVAIVLYSSGENLQKYVVPLPFITLNGTSMTMFSFKGADYTVICSEILSMVTLAFLVNLIDGLLPKGKNMFSWLLMRIFVVFLATLLHAGWVWLQVTYIPADLRTYAPTILLGLILLLLAVGALKPLVALFLTAVHPLIGAFYTFFFATVVGKAVTKAMLTTLVLCILVYALGAVGATVISIASAALIAYIPLVLVLLVIWYLLNMVF